MAPDCVSIKVVKLDSFFEIDEGGIDRSIPFEDE